MLIKKIDKRFKTYGTYQYVIYASNDEEWCEISRLMEKMEWKGQMISTRTRYFRSRYAYTLQNSAFYVYARDLTILQMYLP